MSKAIADIKDKIKKLLKGCKGERNKKITTVVAGDGGPNDLVFEQELPADLVFELCLRLPIHKLFQLMCVSNLWRSIISHPDFSKAYYSRNHSRVFVLSLRDIDNLNSYDRQFYHSLPGEQWVRSPLKIPILGDYPEFTQVINGLFCAYSWGPPYLCNIFTGELMILPDSGDTDDPPSGIVRYYFAFDPVNRLYKLLRLVSYRSKVFSCKILTLGSSCNSSWRKLAVPENVTVTHYLHCRRNIVIHGVLFLYSFWGINAFNFTEENFHSVPLLDEMDFHLNVAQFRGRLAILGNLGFQKMITYMLNDNGNYSWTRRETILPMELQESVVPVGCLPTGEILLAPSYSRVKSEPRDTLTVLYSYDYEENKLEKFEVGKLPKPINFRNNESVISCVEPNIGSLDALIHGDGCFR